MTPNTPGILTEPSVLSPWRIEHAALIESGYASTGAVATDCTIALGFKPTGTPTAPLASPDGHYLLTIQKQGSTVKVWKQGVPLADYTGSVGTTYAAFLSNVLTAYAGSNKGYYSRLVVTEQVLDYSTFWECSDFVTGLWMAKVIDFPSFTEDATTAFTGGTADGSNYNGSYPPSYAFNSLLDSSNCVRSNDYNALTVTYDLGTGNEVALNSIGFQLGTGGATLYSAHSPRNFTIQGSNDGINWDTLVSQTNVTWSSEGQIKTWTPSNSTAYRHYKWDVTLAADGANYIYIGECVGYAPVESQYGSGGCHLDFANAVDLGADISGNGNDWAITGTQTVDTPTDNACTLNPLDPNAGALSNGNLTLASGTAKPTLQPETGQWSYKKGGVEQLYDADVSGKFEPDLTADTYEFIGYAPTSGYKLITISNLPDPTIMKSSTVADVVLREGTGAEAAITSLDFQPDFVNSKDRDNVRSWALADSENLATNYLQTDTTAALQTDAQSLKSFDAGGYTLGTSSVMTHNGASFIDLCLKAGVDQGFEIVKYTGDGVAGRTVSHNLGKAPTFMIVKSTDFSGSSWMIYHKDLTASSTLFLNVTSATNTHIVWWNDTEPTSTDFTLGLSSSCNGSGYDYVAYLFTDSDIFKAFSYTGNGALDGPFVNLSGRVLSVPFLKNADLGTTSWVNMDAVREPYNSMKQYLLPNTSNAEATSGAALMNFTSQGVKLANGSGGWNGASNLHIGLAILESTKHSNAF